MNTTVMEISTVSAKPDFAVAQRFIEALTGSADTKMWFRLLPDGEQAKETARQWERDNGFSEKRNFFGTLTEVWPEIVAHQGIGWGAFCVVNDGGNSKAEIEANGRVRAVFIDADGMSLSNVKWHREPDLIVRRDDLHWHAYWLVDDCPIEEFTNVQKQLIAYYGTDPNVSDLPRVMRIPGTLHLKNPAAAQELAFEPIRDPSWDPRYTLVQITEGLPALPADSPRSGQSSLLPQRTPVTADHLRKLLRYCDPNAPRDEWRNVIAAVRNTVLAGEDDESERLQIALEFSRGELSETKERPPRYTGDDDVEEVFRTMPPRIGGVGYGTIYHAAKAGGYAGPPAQQDTGVVFSEYLQTEIAEDDKSASIARTERSEPAGNDKPFLMTEDDIFSLPDPEELVAGFIMRGENVCIFGLPKVGKTFVALDVALSLAANLPVFEHLLVRKTGAVVYLSGEGHAGMKRRIKAWRQARGIANDRQLPFYYKAAVPNTAAGMDECERYIAGIRGQLGTAPILVVIDTMARSMAGMNENDAGEVGAYLALTEGLRSGLDCTIITLAHSGKDETRGIRGSNASAAGFDAVWYVEMNPSNKTVKIESKWLKDADELGPFCFRLRHVAVKGMALGKGAVLEYVPLDEFKLQSDEADPFAKRKVGAALSERGAIGRDHGVTSRVLLESLLPQLETESEEDWQVRLRNGTKTLSYRTNDKGKRALSLAAYAYKGQGPGGHTLWYLPAPTGDEFDAE